MDSALCLRPPRNDGVGGPPWSPACSVRSGTTGFLELHAVRALEPKRRARLGRGCDFKAQFLDNAADLRDLLGIAFGELARTDIERILKPDADVAAHHRGIGAEIHLVATAGQHRPIILLAEQSIGRALHEQKIVEIGANAAENAEDELHENWRFEHAAIDAMGKTVEVADVVAFVL